MFLVALSLASARAGPMRAPCQSRASTGGRTTVDHCEERRERDGEEEGKRDTELLSDFAIAAVVVPVDVVSLSTAFLLLSPSLHTLFSPTM